MMQTITDIIAALAHSLGNISAIIAALVILIKPLREWFFGLGTIKEGVKCLLRRDMLAAYYRHQGEQQIRQHEYENFVFEYAAYKALKGNSFIDKIYSEIKEWEVVS